MLIRLKNFTFKNLIKAAITYAETTPNAANVVNIAYNGYEMIEIKLSPVFI